MLFPRGGGAGLAANEMVHRRCAAVVHATRQKAGVSSSKTNYVDADGRGPTLQSSARGRTKDITKNEPKPHKTQSPKSIAPPDDEASETGAGLEGLDELLADEDAVRQLRTSLLASLSAQHEQAMRSEQMTPTTPDTEASSSAAALPAGAATTTADRRTNTPKQSIDTSTTINGDGSGPAVPLVVLKKDKARLFVSGNPMVYGGAVDCVIARPPPGIGDPVMVADASRRPLGWGVYNPHSMFRVRLFQMQWEVETDPRVALNVPALVQLRVRQAVELRRALGLPSTDTNVYRLINSEGDRLSGLVADVLGDTVVVQAVAGWVQRYRQDVESAICGATGLSHIVWRPMWKILQEEGLQPPEEAAEADTGVMVAAAAAAMNEGEKAPGTMTQTQANVQAAERAMEAAAGTAGTSVAARVAAGRMGDDDGDDDDEVVAAAAETVEVREAGLRLLASPKGQKTGFYADQRDSRAFLAGLVRAQVAAGSPPSVLDLCCYSGGFGLAAGAAGAARVLGVDSSEPAVKLATANAQLNGLFATASFMRADISNFMKAAVAQGQQYDIVVLDPPKLAPDRGALARARIKYLRLNTLAMRLVRPGGMLMTCSCSGAMTQSGEFVGLVLEAAQQVGRQPTLLRVAGAAADHVLNPAYPEGEYLTNVTMRLL